VTVDRRDLLELTPAILTELANAGLVKRAQRDLEAGQFNTPFTENEGALTFVTADGNTVLFPVGSGLAGQCTCGASVCRHRIGAVLALQRTVAGSVGSTEPVSGEPDRVLAVANEPSETDSASLPELPNITADYLAAALAPRTIASAKRRLTDGYLATVVAADDDEPCVVELGSATVRFLLGADLRYARCNCKQRQGCEHVVLAAWAVNEARAAASTASRSIVSVGSVVARGDGSVADEFSGVSVSDAVHNLVGVVLGDGFAHVGSSFANHVAAVRRLAERARHQWIVELLDQLLEQQVAFDQRSTIDVPAGITKVLAGLVARYRTASDAEVATSLPPAIALGTDERSETALAQLRFTGAGARVGPGPTPGSCLVEVLLVDPASSMLVACRRIFRPAVPSAGAVPTIGGARDEGVAQTGPLVARRSIVRGAAVSSLATGSVVSNAVVRRADRSVEFRTGGLRQTSVTAGDASITRFRDAGIVVEPSLVLAERTNAQPELISPLVVTNGIAAFELVSCDEMVFDPAEQQVHVLATTVGGEQLRMRTFYRDLAPGAPAALAVFARAGSGTVVGHVTTEHGTVTVTPTLLGVNDSASRRSLKVVVPDLFEADDEATQVLAHLPTAMLPDDSLLFEGPIRATIRSVQEVAMRGVRNLGSTERDLEDAVLQLRGVGLNQVAGGVAALAAALRAGSVSGRSSGIVNAWADVAITLLVALEMELPAG
jgi:hypothetical protein